MSRIPKFSTLPFSNQYHYCIRYFLNKPRFCISANLLDGVCVTGSFFNEGSHACSKSKAKNSHRHCGFCYADRLLQASPLLQCGRCYRRGEIPQIRLISFLLAASCLKTRTCRSVSPKTRTDNTLYFKKEYFKFSLTFW